MPICPERCFTASEIGNTCGHPLDAKSRVIAVAQGNTRNGYIEAQNLAIAKPNAVHNFLKKRLGTECFWECGSHLKSTIDLYLPDRTSEDGSFSDLFIPLTDLNLCNKTLDPTSQAVMQAVLTKRLL